MKRSYESHNVSGLYFAGGLQHAHDRRKSAGGFIHVYRYLALALFNHLNVVYEKARWPSVEIQTLSLADWIIKVSYHCVYQFVYVFSTLFITSVFFFSVTFFFPVTLFSLPLCFFWLSLSLLPLALLLSICLSVCLSVSFSLS